jgi:hypothetical protein
LGGEGSDGEARSVKSRGRAMLANEEVSLRVRIGRTRRHHCAEGLARHELEHCMPHPVRPTYVACTTEAQSRPTWGCALESCRAIRVAYARSILCTMRSQAIRALNGIVPGQMDDLQPNNRCRADPSRRSPVAGKMLWRTGMPNGRRARRSRVALASKSEVPCG